MDDSGTLEGTSTVTGQQHPLTHSHIQPFNHSTIQLTYQPIKLPFLQSVTSPNNFLSITPLNTHPITCRMSSDLTAMRWQLIRTIEADQLLEQENIELRQKLKSCEEQLGQVTVAHREACAKIAIGMERTVSQLRSDIGDTRSQYFVEMDLMKQGFKEVAGQLGQMSRKNKELRQQSEALAVANARLQNDLEKSCSHSDKKTGHLSGE